MELIDVPCPECMAVPGECCTKGVKPVLLLGERAGFHVGRIMALAVILDERYTWSRERVDRGLPQTMDFWGNIRWL